MYLIEFIKNNKDIIDTFTNIFTSIGTIGAVITAILLAVKDNKPKIKATADFYTRRTVTKDGEVQQEEHFIQIKVKNLGSIPIKIQYISWKAKFNKMFAYNSIPPQILVYGQTIESLIPYEKFHIIATPSSYRFINSIKARFYKMLVFDEFGNSFSFYVNKSLQEEIKKRLNSP